MKDFLRKDKNKTLIVGFIFLGLLSLGNSFFETKSAEKDPLFPEAPSVDTKIPRGLTLIPIELTNAESISSLIGDMGGVVDLYHTPTESKKGGFRVGTKLKLARAPLNPQQYAVLIPEKDALRFMSFSGPFMAVIHNPAAHGREITGPSRRRVQVDYHN